MILPLPSPTCDHPIADIGPLLCQREPNHSGAHVYVADDAPQLNDTEAVQ